MGVKSAVIKKAKRFLELKKFLGYFSGMGIGIASLEYVHEGGHALVARLLGKEPIVMLNYSGEGHFYTQFKDLSTNSISYPFILSGGVAANYAAAIITAIISRKISREKDPFLKSGIVGFSCVQAIEGPAYSIFNFIYGMPNGDFQKLSSLGIPYYVTIPLTAAASAAIIAYSVLDLDERVPSIKNVLIDKYSEEGLSKREIRKIIKEKRNKIENDLEIYFKESSYEPPKHLNFLRKMGEEKIKLKAKITRKKIENSKLEDLDEENLKFIGKHVERFSKNTGMSTEKTIELFKKYYFA